MNKNEQNRVVAWRLKLLQHRGGSATDLSLFRGSGSI